MVVVVELLIGRAVWLCRNDFVGEFVHVVDEPADKATYETPWAWVYWPAVVAALNAGRLPCSGSEAWVFSVDLGEALCSVDDRNLALVAQAVLRGGGNPVSADVDAAGGDQW